MQDLEAIALLQDAARRSLYEYVVAQGREVSRNEAAEGVGLQRTLAAFHLDRLAAAGLLEVTYRRLTSRGGPGAGRPAKLYRRATDEHAYSAPPRDYVRIARVFAEAIERSGAETRMYDIAREQGAASGRILAQNAPDSESEPFEQLVQELSKRGYEPYAEGRAVRLRNCPFHIVAQDFAAVTCGMNLALLEGMLAGANLGASHEARIDPRAGDCCVTIRF